jgi:molybdopterin synthase sulfur carrier subunit
MIRIVLPYHLRNLAGVPTTEVKLEISGDVTVNRLLNELETHYPMLAGTIRDHVTKQRRAFLRYYACGEDISLESADAVLPAAILSGQEPFIVLGSIAGG